MIFILSLPLILLDFNGFMYFVPFMLRSKEKINKHLFKPSFMHVAGGAGLFLRYHQDEGFGGE